MTLEELLLQKLADWRPAGPGQALTINHPESGRGLSVSAERVDSLASRLTEVRLTCTAAREVGLKEQAEAIAGRVTGLLEPLAVLEVDGERHTALLRSQAPAKRGEDLQYYEVTRHADGTTLVRRYQARRDSGKREAVAFTLTHEALGKLVRDLCD